MQHELKLKSAYKSLVGHLDGTREVWKLRRRWDDDKKMVDGVMWCEDMDWNYLPQDTVQSRAVVNTVEVGEYTDLGNYQLV
jgi:hypothetical protein